MGSTSDAVAVDEPEADIGDHDPMRPASSWSQEFLKRIEFLKRMKSMGRPSRYSPDVRERAVRMVLEHEREHDSQWSAIRSIAAKIGCSSETLRHWCGRWNVTPAAVRA